MVLEVSERVKPTHTGLLLPGDGVEGMGFTVTEVVPAVPVQPRDVAVTE